MTASGVLRTAVGHVRSPIHLNAYALIASNLLASGLGMVFWALAARLYAVEVVGLSAALTSLMLFVSGATQLNLRVVLLRLVPAAGRSTRRLVARSYAIAAAGALAGSVVVYGAAITLATPWAALAGVATAGGIVALAIGTLALSLFNLQDGVIAGLRRTVWVPVENGITAVARIGLLVALVGVMPALGIVTAMTLPVVGAVAVVTIVLFRRWIPAHETRSGDRTVTMDRRTLLGFVAADSVGALFALASTTLMPVLVVLVAGAEQGAYFAMAWAVIVALTLFPLNIAASMTVETVHAGQRPGARLRTVLHQVVRLLAPLLVGVIVAAPWLLRVFGEAYAANATDLLRVAALGLVPFAANALALALARVAGHGGEILRIQVATAVLTLGLTALLLPTMGLVGVGVAWLVGQSVVAAVTVPMRLLPALRDARA